MGKKSKTPRKADKGAKDRNPFFRAVDDILAKSLPRVGLPPLAAACPHMTFEVANMEKLEQLRNELKEFQGRRCLTIINGTAALTSSSSGRSRVVQRMDTTETCEI